MKRLLITATLFGVLGGLAAVAALGNMSLDLGPAGVSVAWGLAPTGATVLAFPPLGTVSAVTHSGPSRLLITLERVDLDSLRAFLNAPQDDRIKTIDDLTQRALEALEMFVARLLVIAALGGVVLWGGVSLVAGHRPKATSLVTAALSAILTLGGMMGMARATYDLGGFQSPVYNGALEAVPWLVDTVNEAILTVEELDQRLRILSNNLYRMYQRVESFPPAVALEAADVTVLHITDIHNHPSAVGIVGEIARSFDVDFIVNTGDLTDFGTVLETELVDGLARIDVPQLFVSGNHESPSVIDKIESLNSMTLLDGRQVRQTGLIVAGLPDPGAYRDSAASMTPTEAMSHANAINERLAAMHEAPDILALHNFRAAQGVNPGLVPAILFGHSHTPGVQFRSGTAYVNAGTTGGAGLRGIEANQDVPITLAVIYFERLDKAAAGDMAAPPVAQDAQGSPMARVAPFRSRVLGVDILRLSPFAGGFTLERHIAPR